MMKLNPRGILGPSFKVKEWLGSFNPDRYNQEYDLNIVSIEKGDSYTLIEFHHATHPYLELDMVRLKVGRGYSLVKVPSSYISPSFNKGKQCLSI